MTPTLLHSLTRCTVVIMTLCAMVASVPDFALPDDKLDVDRFFERLEEFPFPDIDPNAIRNAENRVEDHKRRAVTEDLTRQLEDGRQRWRQQEREFTQRLQVLNRELAQVQAQAARDAKIRALADFFQLLAVGGSLAQQVFSESHMPDTGSADKTPSDHTPLKDGLHIQEQYQRIIQVCEGGTCRPVEMRQIINESIRPSGSTDSSDIRQMRSQLHQLAAKLPSSNDAVIRYDIETESLSLRDVTPVRTPSSLASERSVSPRVNSTVPPAIEAGLGRLVTKKLWKRAIPLKKKPIPETGKSAYERAKQGGKHHGLLQEYKGKSPKEIERGIKKLGKRIREHEEKIRNPSKHVKNFKKLPPEQKKHLVEEKWRTDIQRQRDQQEILKGILEDRRGGP